MGDGFRKLATGLLAILTLTAFADAISAAFTRRSRLGMDEFQRTTIGNRARRARFIDLENRRPEVFAEETTRVGGAVTSRRKPIVLGSDRREIEADIVFAAGTGDFHGAEFVGPDWVRHSPGIEILASASQGDAGKLANASAF